MTERHIGTLGAVAINTMGDLVPKPPRVPKNSRRSGRPDAPGPLEPWQVASGGPDVENHLACPWTLGHKYRQRDLSGKRQH